MLSPVGLCRLICIQEEPMAPATAKRTLYRLAGVAPTLDAMFDALDHAQLTALDAQIHVPDDRLQAPALLITAAMTSEEASWCREVARTTGCRIVEPVRRTAALLLIAVDEAVYAIGYDQGYRLLPGRVKDQRFGLTFAIRQVDPLQVRDLVSQTLGEARTDIAIVPGGTPVLSLGLREHAQIVRRLGGYLDRLELTRARSGNGAVCSADGGCGLSLPLGIEPDDLLADIREIARVCRDTAPQPALEFVEHIVPVKDETALTRLESALDDILGAPPDGRLAVTVPTEQWEDYSQARTFHLRIASDEAGRFEEFDLDYVLQRARLQRRGQRLEALRRGTVTLYGRERATPQDQLSTTPALRWLEACISLGAWRFCLLEGDWYEIGTEYLATVRGTVERLFTPSPSVDLPAWAAGVSERSYNEHVPDQRPGYVCMDRKNVANPLRPTDGFEVCDLLTPDNTLVMVKHAHGGSGPLSHLFSQGLVAVQLLKTSAEVRRRFASRVLQQSNGRHTLPDDFVPKRVVFAILLKQGTALTPETLFPFSLITLAQTAKMLETLNVTVEVVGIHEASSASHVPQQFNAAA
jgi:uncharacterized protein (TIGR04141 family)